MIGPQSGILLKALPASRDWVACAIDARDTFQLICDRLGAFPPAMEHIVGAGMGAMLLQAMRDPDDEESLEFQWASNGPFGTLHAESFGFGKIRVHLDTVQATETNKLSFPLGEGVFQVRRKLPHDMRNTSLIQSVGWPRVDIQEFLKTSENPASFWDFSFSMEWKEDRKPSPLVVTQAMGYLVQLLPRSEEPSVSLASTESFHAFLQDLGPLQQWELDGTNSREKCLKVLQFLNAGKSDFHLVKESPTQLYCPCSLERATRALSLMTKAEKESFREPGKPMEVICGFCGEKYQFADAG